MPANTPGGRIKLSFRHVDHVVAFDAESRLSRVARAAIGLACKSLTTAALDDAALAAGGKRPRWDELYASLALPHDWEKFMSPVVIPLWAVAAINVAHGWSLREWRGPSCLAETMAQREVFRVAGTSLPAVYDVDTEALVAELQTFADEIFEEPSRQFLSSGRADVFEPLYGRPTHPLFD